MFDFNAYLANSQGLDICSWILIGLSYLLMIVTLPFSLCFCIKVYISIWKYIYSIAVCIDCSRIWTSCYSSSWSCFIRYNIFIFYLNFIVFFFVLGGAKGPGLFCILPCVDAIVTIDLRTATFNVPPQEVYNFIVTIRFPMDFFKGFVTWFGYCISRCSCL